MSNYGKLQLQKLYFLSQKWGANLRKQYYINTCLLYTSSGFQGIQSMFAIAPSGLFGLGYNNSMQKHFFLPEPQNDFKMCIRDRYQDMVKAIL